MVKVLVGETNRLGVNRLPRTLITELLKYNGEVVGAVGFNSLTGEFYIIKAGVVILATGQAGWKAGHHGNTSTGDGMAIALKAGAELKNCEFSKVWNFARPFAWEGQTTLLPLGARFINAKGETFMDKYSPVLGNNTDPHFNVLGMAFEAREGRGPFYLDCKGMKSSDIELMKPGAGWQKLNYEKLIKLGISFFENRTEWTPQLTGSYEGLVVDMEGRTKLPGLFAVGMTWALEPGVYMGGWALCRTAVTGYAVGQNAGKYVAEKQKKPVKIEAAEVEKLKARLFAPLGKAGLTPKEVMTSIQEIVFPYDVCLLKSEKTLKEALNRLERLKNEILPRMTAQDTHYLLKLMEVRSMALTGELYLKASLMRTESRAGHFREDFPKRDDSWLKWIVASQENGKLSFKTQPVPVERYKFKPTRYYSDNFKFS